MNFVCVKFVLQNYFDRSYGSEKTLRSFGNSRFTLLDNDSFTGGKTVGLKTTGH